MHNKQTLLQLSKEERAKSSRCYISNILPTPVTIIILHDFLCGRFSSLSLDTKETQSKLARNIHTLEQCQPHFSPLSFLYLNPNRDGKQQ